MKTARIIPCLDVDAGRVVKGVNFVDLIDAGDPVELAARYDAEGADELVFVDITASHEARDTTVEMAARVAEEVFIPFTIGGGIRSVEDARRLLRAGADKVSVNTSNPRSGRRASMATTQHWGPNSAVSWFRCLWSKRSMMTASVMRSRSGRVKRPEALSSTGSGTQGSTW